MKDLFVFGDSWPQGAELKPGEKTFGEIIAKNLDFNFNNRAIPSTGIPHLILQVQEVVQQSKFFNLNKNRSLFLFFLSSPLRDLIWKEGKNIGLNPTHPEDVEWYAKYSSDELIEYRTNTTLLALQKICSYYQIQSFFVWGWDKVDLWPEIDTTNFYPISCAEMFTDNYTTIINLKNSKNKYIWPNGGHPNQLGHQLIADNLSKFIQEKLTHF